MIFFCFSSKDRLQIVEAMLFHITNYELPVWYDRHKMLMGDDRDYKNFDEGINQCEYAIIIVSPNAIASTCAREEIELIRKRYEADEMTVFPVFYNLKASELPAQLQWMTKLVYKELDASTDSRSACNHIICRVLLDELEKYRIKSINDFLTFCGTNSALGYPARLLKAYCKVSDDNRDAQITLLSAVPILKRLSHLPVVVDPSHASGIAWLVEPLAMAAVAAGADGLIIEVHNNPSKALSDGAQSLTPDQFDHVAKRVRGLSAFLKNQEG